MRAYANRSRASQCERCGDQPLLEYCCSLLFAIKWEHGRRQREQKKAETSAERRKNRCAPRVQGRREYVCGFARHQ